MSSFRDASSTASYANNTGQYQDYLMNFLNNPQNHPSHLVRIVQKLAGLMAKIYSNDVLYGVEKRDTKIDYATKTFVYTCHLDDTNSSLILDSVGNEDLAQGSRNGYENEVEWIMRDAQVLAQAILSNRNLHEIIDNVANRTLERVQRVEEYLKRGPGSPVQPTSIFAQSPFATPPPASRSQPSSPQLSPGGPRYITSVPTSPQIASLQLSPRNIFSNSGPTPPPQLSPSNIFSNSGPTPPPQLSPRNIFSNSGPTPPPPQLSPQMTFTTDRIPSTFASSPFAPGSPKF